MMNGDQRQSAVADIALREAAARTAALLGRVPDASATVPGLAWTIAETAAHIVGELRHYTEFVTGARDARDYMDSVAQEQTPSRRTALANARQLEEFSERDLTCLADMLVRAADDFVAAGARREPSEGILTATGLTMTMPTMTAALLGEQLVHGLDIARAASLPWKISPADALLVIAGVMAMVPDYIDRQRAAGLHLSYEVRFRGGPRYRLAIDDGRAVVTESGPKVDCWISADPVAFLLIGYGRTGQWGQILRGKIVSGGRKPWLGLKFSQLITGP